MCVVLFLLYFCTEKCYILLLFPKTSISSRFTDGVCTFTRSAAHLLTLFFFSLYSCIVVSHCYVRFDSISASKRSPPLFVLFFFFLFLLIMCYNCAFASSSSFVFNTTRVFPMSLRVCVCCLL